MTDVPDPREQVRTLVGALNQAGADVAERFIDVDDGGKGTHSHERFGPDRIDGNYGVYPNGDVPGGLVLVDVDRAEGTGFDALEALPETFTVTSPHAQEGEGHRYYIVEPGETLETAAEVARAVWGGQTHNPIASFGEVRLLNQYVVGPGSQLDGCDKDWCDSCDDPAGGWYTVEVGGPIATITTDDLAAVLAADPNRPVQTSTTADGSTDEDFDEWLTDELVEEALSHLDPDVGYGEWRNIGFAVHAYDPSANGRRLFERWSRRGSKWDHEAERIVRWIWSNAEAGDGVSTIGVGRLVDVAKRAGWDPSPGRNALPNGGTIAAGGDDTTQAKTPAVRLFEQAVKDRDLDHTAVAKPVGDEEGDRPVAQLLGGRTVPDAVLAFWRHASLLNGHDREAVIATVVRRDLEEQGEFFKTGVGHLYYFDDGESRLFRVDGDGRRTLDEEFQGYFWDRYNLAAGKFSNAIGEDLVTKARYGAPTREVYRFAHYDEDVGELYVTDFGNGYYTLSPRGIEWRANGTDVFFLEQRAESYTYIEPDERDPLPDAIPGELEPWVGDGDAIMRLFANRVNYAEGAAAGPADQRDQLYLHLHALPFIDLLTARPIMIWVGDKGAGKTVVQRSIGKFIYGPDFTESAMPDDRKDFMAKIVNQPLAFIDNYDEGVDWLNDFLAAIVTGSGIDVRQYWTTLDLRQETPRCWLSLTSRDPPDRRDDVADRTLVFRVERLGDDVVPMPIYRRQVTDRRDLLWSVYLDNLVDIIETYQTTDIDAMTSEHRMADWAIFATIIGRALGYDDDRLTDLLEVMQVERSTFSLEHEHWAHLLGRWIRDHPTQASQYRKAGDLLERLQSYAAEKGLPAPGVKGPPAMGMKLKKYRSEIAELYGLEVDEGRANRYRFDTDAGPKWF